MNSLVKSVCGNMLLAGFLAATLPATPAAAASSRTAKCQQCGTVLTTNRKDEKASGTTGAVVGGVGGAVAGKVVGDSNTSAVLGGIGGALAGNMIGKKMGTKKIWSVQVAMDKGGTRDIDYDTDPEFKQGDRVRIVGGRLERR